MRQIHRKRRELTATAQGRPDRAVRRCEGESERKYGSAGIGRGSVAAWGLAVKDNRRLFPPAYQEELAAAEGDMHLQTRVVVDYVASMTEHEVAHVYALLTGK